MSEEWKPAGIPFYKVSSREDEETGSIFIRVQSFDPGGYNRGVILDVSPNVLFPVIEGQPLVHIKVTQNTYEAVKRWNDKVVRLDRKVKEAKNLLRRSGYDETKRQLMDLLNDMEEETES